MLDIPSAVVRVRREWNAWHTAEVSLEDLEQIHWYQPAGAPQRLLHAYVSCARLAEAGIAHACATATTPHRVLVCVLRRHLLPSVCAEIERRAAATV